MMGYFNSQFIVFLCIIIQAVVAEWLRRLTRNQIPSGSVGSSPTDCETFLHVSSNAIKVADSLYTRSSIIALLPQKQSWPSG